MNWPSSLPLALATLLALAGHQPAPPAVWQLAPAIAPAPPARAARGTFLSRSQALVLPGGTLRLASTPDGRGELCSDDRATVSVQGAQQTVWHWEHVFASADRQGITCVEPQPVLIPSAGSYTVTITLEDLFPDTYSSRPYYLVMPRNRTSASAAPATPSQAPTATRAAPTATAFDPTAAPLLTPPPRTSAEVPAPRHWPGFLLWLGWAALAAMLVLLVARRYRSRRGAPAAQAILDLFDQETREARTLALATGTTWIARRPLRVMRGTASGEAATAIAQIRLAADRAELSMPNLATSAPVTLLPAQRYALAGGAVMLRYRGPVPPPHRAAAAQKGRTR